MHPVSRPASRKDHAEKACGSAKYLADLPAEGVLAVRFVRSKKANAAIATIQYPTIPPGYFCADRTDLADIGGTVEELGMPVFAMDRVRYVGEAIAAIAGPDAAVVASLVKDTIVTYTDEQPAITSPACAREFFCDVQFGRGDPDSRFANADFVHEETFETGLQEQAYLETQAIQAENVDGVLTIWGSMQCPYYIHSALKQVFHRADDQLRVIQTTTGGGFGGKEDYPSLLACQVSVLALKAAKPCRAVYDRHEDMAVTPKRHPARLAYRVAVQDGRVSAVDVDILLDGGAYHSLSQYVMNRTMISSIGAYNIEDIHVRGRVAVTNTPSNGAFRGFGGPQAFFAIETMMNHIAARVGEDPVTFKEKHLVRKGDRTATNGLYHEHVPLPAMLSRALAMSAYEKRSAAYANEQGRYRHGIGFSLFFHGCGFSGNGERDFIRAQVKLIKHADGSVDILGANTEMGQGVRTTFPKIVATALGIPYEKVHYLLPDTAVAPDSGPTVASRSILITGRLLERAANKLKKNWVDGEEQTITEGYVDPPHRISFDYDTFTGDAYPAFSWGVNVVEVEVDTCTCQPRVTNVWAVYDCGTPIDLNALHGQADGGIVQGLGYGGMERMQVRPDGSIPQASLTDYIIPTAADASPIHVEFHDDPYYDGPFGARGAGELTIVGAAPAYVAAVENALRIEASQIPLTPERILTLRRKEA